MVVKDLIDQDKGNWNLDILNSILDWEDVEAIFYVPILKDDRDDVLIWRWSN